MGAASALAILYGLMGVGRLFAVQFYFGYHPRYFSLALLGEFPDMIVWAASAAILLISLKGLPWRLVALAITLMLALLAGLSGVNYPLLMSAGLLIPMATLVRGYGLGRLDSLRLPLLLSLSLILAIVEVGAALSLLAYPLHRTIFTNPLSLQLLRIEFELGFLAYPFLMGLVIILLLSGLIVGGLLCLSEWEGDEAQSRAPRRLDFFVVPIIAVLSLLVSHYAWSFGADLVGIDAPWYRGELEIMAGPLHALAVANKDPRGFLLLILYAIKSLTGTSSTEALRLGIALCAFLNGASAYFLASRQVGPLAGVLSSTLAILAVQTTVGFFAGIYANWFALALAGFYFYAVLKLISGEEWGCWTTILRLLPSIGVGIARRLGGMQSVFTQLPYARNFLKSIGGESGIASIVISLLILLMHPWTWIILIASTALLTLLLWFQSGTARTRSLFFALLTTAAVPAAIFLTVLALSPSSLFGARMGLGEGLELLPLIQFAGVTALMKTLSTTLETYVQSLLADPLQYALALVGAFSLPKMRRGFALAVASWMTVPGLAALFVTPWYQWRLLYALPLGLLSGLGLTLLAEVFGAENSRAAKALVISSVVVVVLAMLNHTLRAIAHTIWMLPV